MNSIPCSLQTEKDRLGHKKKRPTRKHDDHAAYSLPLSSSSSSSSILFSLRWMVLMSLFYFGYWNPCRTTTTITITTASSHRRLFVSCLVPLNGRCAFRALSHASPRRCPAQAFNRGAEIWKSTLPLLSLSSTSRTEEQKDSSTSTSAVEKDQGNEGNNNEGDKQQDGRMNDIQGLMLSTDDLNQWQTAHATLKCLQEDFPDLWIRPLSSRRLQESHTVETKLILLSGGKNSNIEPIILAKNRDELVQLQNSAALAIQTPLRATEFVLERLGNTKTFTNATSFLSTKKTPTPLVECRIILPLSSTLTLTIKVVSECLNHITVKWETSFPSLPATTSSSSRLVSSAAAGLSPLLDTKLKGVSQLQLQNGKIARHEVTKLRWKRGKNSDTDNNEIDTDIDDDNDDDDDTIANSEALLTLLGQALTQGRSTLRTLEQSIAASPFAAFLPPDLQKGATQWIQQQVEAATSTATIGATTAGTATSTGMLAPIFVELPKDTKDDAMTTSKNMTRSSKRRKKSNTTTRSTWVDVVPVDEFVKNNADLPPLPGSSQWNRYAKRHELIQMFVEESIPALAEQQQQQQLQQHQGPFFQFASDAKLFGLDKRKTLLLESPRRLEKWYHFQNTWRRRTLAKWTLQKATAVGMDHYGNENNSTDDNTSTNKISAKVRIDYHIEYPSLPTTTTTTSIQQPTIRGTDLYTISHVSTLDDENNNDDNDKRRTMMMIPVIESIHQEKLVLDFPGQQGQLLIASDLINNQQQDGSAAVLFMRSMIAAMDNDLSVSTTGMMMMMKNDDSWWRELLPRGLGFVSSSLLSTSQQDDDTSLSKIAKTRVPPLRLDNDAAAATIYRIMATLHQDALDLVDTSSSSSPLTATGLPAVSTYMTDQVELRGLLDEVLIRSCTSYQQTFDFSIATPLRTALRTKIVESTKDPTVQVELTRTGSIMCFVTLHLRIVSTPITAIATSTGVAAAMVDTIVAASKSDSIASRTFSSLATGAANAASRANKKIGTGLPLTLSFKSEYILDSETGRIEQHLLLESRVNDILTPENVLSQWIRQQQKRQQREPSAGSRSVDLFSSGSRRTLEQVLDWLIRSSNDK